jgi:uncharacterized protein YbjT (DUF2867 family)
MSATAPALAEGVLVFGGTGQLGARIVRLLVEAGEDVTVFARPNSDRSRLGELEVRYAIGDMLDEDSVAAAFSAAQFRAVIYAARAPISDVPFYDLTSGYIASYAKATGVSQIIHHGAVGAGDNMVRFPDIPWDAVPGLRGRMEDHGAAERNYFQSGVNTTILRNSRVWPDDTPGTGKAELTEDQSTMTPTTRADLAVLTMQCLDNPACANRIYHVRDDTLSWPPPGWGE